MEAKESQYLNLFKEVCKKINSSLDLGDVLTSITENAALILGVKGCAIFLLDAKNSRLKMSASHGLSAAYIAKGPVDAEKSIVETLSGRQVLVPDATDDRRMQYPAAARKEGIVSVLSTPMLIRDKIIGVLRIYASERRDFSDIERQFIAGLAEIGSIGIENARMYHHLKSDHEKLINDVHQWFDYGNVN